MPRPPRHIVQGVPLHITQRGVNRCPTFHDEGDFALYRWALRLASAESRCAVHAYVLMTNHVHLLLTPADVGGPARLMRSLGGRYVRYFNDRHRRTGTLWEGRYRSTLVDSDRYFFACSRYIELNPVRAGLADAPPAYEWSSFHHNAGGEEDPIITPHPLYMALGASRGGRCATYRALHGEALAGSAVAAIRTTPLARRTLQTAGQLQAVEALTTAPDGAGARRDQVAVPGAVAHVDGGRPVVPLRPVAADARSS